MPKFKKSLPDVRKLQPPLVVYFSHSGNTRALANQVHERVGGDLFEIVPVHQYPADYDAAVAQARRELDSGHKPALKTKMENVSPYDVIFIGYPTWWGTVPRPIVTFLAELDLSGKTIVPFCTHEGSGLGRSITDIAKLCPRSNVTKGLAVQGSDVNNAGNKVSAWLDSMLGSNGKR
jgi:flavodoxin